LSASLLRLAAPCCFMFPRLRPSVRARSSGLACQLDCLCPPRASRNWARAPRCVHRRGTPQGYTAGVLSRPSALAAWLQWFPTRVQVQRPPGCLGATDKKPQPPCQHWRASCSATTAARSWLRSGRERGGNRRSGVAPVRR
jgi:hypothetical protein